MPELPEVETIRRDLLQRLCGIGVHSLWASGKPLRLLHPIPEYALKLACVGARIRDVRRKAKYLLIDFEQPKGWFVVIVHLGMTGRLRIDSSTSLLWPHTHVLWRLENGLELRYVDARRFGWIEVVKQAQLQSVVSLHKLGVDPLQPDFTPDFLFDAVRGRKTNIKALLFDQTIVAGLGNIYICEALHQARLDPRMAAHRMTRLETIRLHDAIVDVLECALDFGGTTLRDYMNTSGQTGQYQKHLHVYNQAGRLCKRQDGGIIRRIVQQSRSTFFCPRCQKRR